MHCGSKSEKQHKAYAKNAQKKKDERKVKGKPMVIEIKLTNIPKGKLASVSNEMRVAKKTKKAPPKKATPPKAAPKTVKTKSSPAKKNNSPNYNNFATNNYNNNIFDLYN